MIKWTTRHYYDHEESALGDLNGDGLTDQSLGLIVRTVFPTVDTYGAAFLGESAPFPLEKTFTYNNAGQLLSMTDEAGTVTTYAYWPEGNPSGQGLDPSQATSGSADSGGYLGVIVKDSMPIGSTPALELTTVMRYDARGNQVEVIDPRGNITRRQFDNLDRLIVEQRFAEDGVTELVHVETQYDGNGNVSAMLEGNFLPDGSPVLAFPVIQTLYTYDAEDRLLQIDEQVSASNWQSTRYRYDKNGNRVLEMRPRANDSSSPDYDPTDIVSRIFDERDKLYNETWGGLPAEFIGLSAHDHIDLTALGLSVPFTNLSTETTTYGANGERVHVVGAEGRETLVTLDGHGRPVEVEDSLGNVERLEYDVRGRVTLRERLDSSDILLSRVRKRFDEHGSLIELERDLLGQLPGDLVLTSMLYDERGRRIASEDYRGLRQTRIYDRVGRLTDESDAYGNAVVYEYDDTSNRTKVTKYDAGSSPVETSALFNALNRRMQFTDAEGGSCAFEYDSRGNVVKKTDQLGYSTYYSYDGVGRMLSELRETVPGGCQPYDPLLCVTSIREYDLNGNLESFADGESKVHLMQTNNLGRTESSQVGSSTPLNVSYYKNGRMHLVTDGNGTVVEHFYDAAGRLESRVISPGPGVSGQTTLELFTWDGLDRLSTVSNSGTGLGTSVTRTYDAMHRLRSETLFHETQTMALSHDIDGAAGLSTLTYSAGLGVVMEFHPDLNAVEDVVIDGVPTFHYEYEGPGRVSARDTTPGGASSWRLDYDYDVNRRFTLHDHTFVAGGASGNRIAGFAYDHDGLHRQSSVLRLHDGLGDQYVYDGLSQLEKIRYDVPAAEINNPTTTSFGYEASYVYDRTENRVAASEGGPQEIYTVDPCDNVYTAIDGVALLYDGNGNLTDDGTYLYTYDFANRLVLVESQSNAVLVKFAYDALGRRIRKEVPGEYTPIDMWSGSRLMEQREDQDLDGTYERVRQLVYGPAVDDVIQVRIDGVPYFPITAMPLASTTPSGAPAKARPERDSREGSAGSWLVGDRGDASKQRP